MAHSTKDLFEEEKKRKKTEGIQAISGILEYSFLFREQYKQVSGGVTERSRNTCSNIKDRTLPYICTDNIIELKLYCQFDLLWVSLRSESYCSSYTAIYSDYAKVVKKTGEDREE